MADLNKGRGSMQIVPRRSLIALQLPLSPMMLVGLAVEHMNVVRGDLLQEFNASHGAISPNKLARLGG
jgi:hypothetical protein